MYNLFSECTAKIIMAEMIPNLTLLKWYVEEGVAVVALSNNNQNLRHELKLLGFQKLDSVTFGWLLQFGIPMSGKCPLIAIFKNDITGLVEEDLKGKVQVNTITLSLKVPEDLPRTPEDFLKEAQQKMVSELIAAQTARVI